MRCKTSLALALVCGFLLGSQPPAAALPAIVQASVTNISSGWATPGESVTFSSTVTALVGGLPNVNIGYALINTATGAQIAYQGANFNLALGQSVTVSQTFVVPSGTTAGAYRAELRVNNNAAYAAPAPQLWALPRAGCFTVTAAASANYGLPLRGCSTLASGYLSAYGSQFTDANGNPMRISSIGWQGTDGPAGAASTGLWTVSYKTVLSAIRAAGFNAVRIPWTDANLNARADGYTASLGTIDNANTGNNADLRDPAFPQPNAQGRYTYKKTIDIFQTYVNYASTIGLKIIFDHHSNEGDLGQQANGLWFDNDPAHDLASDGYAPNDGVTTYLTFKNNWVALAQRFAANPTVIGFELDNEPFSASLCTAQNPYAYCSPVIENWGVTHDQYDIAFMAQDVGNAIQAVDPGALIILEAPFEGIFGRTIAPGFDPNVQAADGDLTPVKGFGSTPAKPITLNVPHKIVYSAHHYPAEISGITPAGVNYAASYINGEWGFVASQNLAPMIITEMGACIAGANTSIDAKNFLADIIPYLNGGDGASGGPALGGNRQGVSTSWWVMGDDPDATGSDTCSTSDRDPNGIQTQWSLGDFRADALAYTDQLLFHGVGDASANASVIGVGGSIIDYLGNSWAIADGKALINGVADASTSSVVELAFVAGIVWRQDASNLWYSKASPTSTWSAGVSTPPVPASPGGTVIVSGSGPIIDLQGNFWSIGGGVVMLNGVPDISTANVIEMVYYSGGEVWFETSSRAWYWKASAAQQYWSLAATPFIGVSANSTVVTEGGGSIVDANQNAWTIVGGQIVVNGLLDATTVNVIELAYVNGVIWQKNVNNLWRSKTLPTDSWLPSGGSATRPAIAISGGNSVVYPGGGSLTDANNVDWTISNGQIVIGGVIDATTANVVELAYVGGKIWQKNANDLWWSKTSQFDVWLPVNGTSVAPL